MSLLFNTFFFLLPELSNAILSPIFLSFTTFSHFEERLQVQVMLSTSSPVPDKSLQVDGFDGRGRSCPFA